MKKIKTKNEFMKNQECYCITAKSFLNQKVFSKERDYNYYLRLLRKYKSRFHIKIFAFCILPKSVWLVLQPLYHQNLSQFIEEMNQSYALYYYARYCSNQTLWQKEFKSLALTKDEDLFRSIKYVEFIPVRANISKTPMEYSWSSCNYRIFNQENGLIDSKAFVPHVK